MENPSASSSSSMKQTNANDSQDVEIQGYLHSLSPIKNTKKKQTPYFDFFLQTSDTNKVRGICYEPQQRKNLLQPFQKKSPVKITGTKRISTTSFSTTNEEFKIKKKI